MKQYDNLSKGMLGRLVSNIKSKLASVAFSGKYSDLSDAPNPNNFVKKAGDVMSGTLETSRKFNAFSGFSAFNGSGMSYYDATGRRRMWSGVDGDNERMGLYSNDDNDYFVWRDDDGTHVDINADAVGGENKYIRSVRQENGKLVAEEAKGPFIELTLDEWNALPDTKLTDGVQYFITDGVSEGLPEVVGDLLTTVKTNLQYEFTVGNNYKSISPNAIPDESGEYKIAALVGVEISTAEPVYLKGWVYNESNKAFHVHNAGTGTTTKGVIFTWLMIRKDILALVKGGR